jgi:hypothetical protein
MSVTGVYASPAGFDKAVEAYNNHQYSAALSQFQSVSAANPGDVMSHYYMGLCNQYLSQMGAAHAEYDWVYNHTSDPALRQNSSTALQQLDSWGQHRSYEGQGNVTQQASVQGNSPPRDDRDDDGPVVPARGPRHVHQRHHNLEELGKYSNGTENSKNSKKAENEGQGGGSAGGYRDQPNDSADGDAQKTHSHKTHSSDSKWTTGKYLKKH